MDDRGLRLDEVTAVLESIAPPALAEAWDNVGLLVEPLRARRIRHIMLTIDLTEEVMAEALARDCQFIVTYHPVLFDPVRHLRASEPQHRVVMQAVRKSVAVYSPHTALDSVEGGVNDWLADGLGTGARAPLRPAPAAPGSEGAQVCGQGRFVTLDRPVRWPTLLQRMRGHLGLDQLRVATPATSESDGRVGRVALCAGAGGSVLMGVDADVYLTGEMRHHDVLAATSRGIRVVLSEHSHTERGYLPQLGRRLRRDLGSRVRVIVSRRDRDPVQPA